MPALDANHTPIPEESQLPPRASLLDRVAFLFSAVLSPYIVLPVGSVGIIYGRSPSSHFLLWAGISIFFSTFLPALYVVIGVLRGKISDVHVMERGQRTGPFIVTIIGGFIAAYLLYRLHAPTSVWGLSVLLSFNGLVISLITLVTKISVHVAVLSATVLGAITLHPETNPWSLLWLIPVLIWARQARGRHSVWQGIGGCLVASIVTAGTLYGLGLGDRIQELFQRAL
jgi:hypothetical protein